MRSTYYKFLPDLALTKTNELKLPAQVLTGNNYEENDYPVLSSVRLIGHLVDHKPAVPRKIT